MGPAGLGHLGLQFQATPPPLPEIVHLTHHDDKVTVVALRR
jgi:hypothetical protein